MRERMEYSRAEELVKELSETTIDVMKRAGLPVEVGQIDLDGKPLTQERVQEFKTELDKTFWGALKLSFIIKETITQSEAQGLADKARRAFFKPFEDRGIHVKEGMPDGSGKPFTKESVEKIHREINGGIWGIINDFYDIEDDRPSS